MENCRFYRQRTTHYKAHQIRLCHEDAKRLPDLERLINNPHMAMVISDYAMKLLHLLFREHMAEWFGKKGIAWEGRWIIWWNEEKECLEGYRINQLCDDAHEDGELCAQNLATALKAHTVTWPEHTEFTLNSDGAGCYNGITFLARAAYFWVNYGFKIIDCCTGESGGGKDIVDRGFAVSKVVVRRGVVEGLGAMNAISAASVVVILSMHKSESETVIHYVTIPQRALDDMKPLPPNKEVRDAKLQSAAYRKIIYDPDTKLPLYILVFEQSGLDVAPFATISVDGLWASNVLVGDRSTLAKTVENAKLAPTREEVHPFADAARNRREKKERFQSKAAVAGEKESLKQKARKAQEENSLLHHCPKEGCVRSFTSHKWLEKHIDQGEHQMNGVATRKSKTAIDPTNHEEWSTWRDFAATVLSKHTIGQLEHAPLPPASTAPSSSSSTPLSAVASTAPSSSSSTPLSAVASTAPSSSSSTPLSAVADIPELMAYGCAKRSLPKAPPLHPEIKIFCHWCWMKGEQGLSKIIPKEAQKLIPLFGTQEGRDKFPGDEYWNKAFVECHGRQFFLEGEVPQDTIIRRYYNQFNQDKKSDFRMVVQTAALTPEQRKEELLQRLRDTPSLEAFFENNEHAHPRSGRLDAFGTFVKEAIESSPNSKLQYGSFKQMHLKGWYEKDSRKMTLKEKQDVVKVITTVGKNNDVPRTGVAGNIINTLQNGNHEDSDDDDDDEDQDNLFTSGITFESMMHTEAGEEDDQEEDDESQIQAG
jgi:hypothetical protein